VKKKVQQMEKTKADEKDETTDHLRDPPLGISLDQLTAKD